MVDAPRSPVAGEQLGAYTLEEQLGRGGMGAVWRARHHGTGRAVALKLIHARYADATNVTERFRREARVLGRLQHPYIVDVTDFGDDRGHLYLVMELLGGRSLRDELRARGPLPVAEVVEIVDQVVAALEHAHEQGVIHRDLKPDNLQLVPAGDGRTVVRVLDFGIARLGEDDRAAPSASSSPTPLSPREPGSDTPMTTVPTVSETLTGHGAILGTPAYMAPEQVFSKPTSPATDVYALASLIWECLTGTAPRVGTPMQIFAQHLQRTAPVLADRRVPRGVAAVIASALDPEMERRPTARVLAGQLRALAAGADVVYAAALERPVPGRVLVLAPVVVPVATLIVMASIAGTAASVVPPSWVLRVLPVYLLTLAVVPAWCAAGTLAAVARRLPLLRALRGGMMAQATPPIPAHLRRLWWGLSARAVLESAIPPLLAVVVGTLAAVGGAVEASLVGRGNVLTAFLAMPAAAVIAAVFLSVRQVQAGELLGAVLRGEAFVPVPRRRRLPGWARVAGVVVAGMFLLTSASRPLLHRALIAGAGGADIAAVLILLGVSAAPGPDFDPLVVAVTHGADETLLALVLDRAGPVDRSTALHAAIRAHNSAGVRHLCAGPVDVTRRDASGRSALSLAAAADPPARTAIVRTLLRVDRTALDVPDADGVTPRARLRDLQDPAIERALASPP